MDPATTIHYLLMDLLESFRPNAPTREFWCFLDWHKYWLSSLESDIELYNPIHRAYLTEIKDFLKRPQTVLEKSIDLTEEEYTQIKQNFGWYVNSSLISRNIDEFFTPIVYELEYILDRTEPHDYETVCEGDRVTLQPQYIHIQP